MKVRTTHSDVGLISMLCAGINAKIVVPSPKVHAMSQFDANASALMANSRAKTADETSTDLLCNEVGATAMCRAF